MICIYKFGKTEYSEHYDWRYVVKTITNKNNLSPSADPEGGPGGPEPPPPLRFVRDGVLCRGLMGRRGVQQLFLSYYNQFFLRSPVLYKHITCTCIHTSNFNLVFGVERSSFLCISLIQIMKRIQLPIPCFYERGFSYFSCLELHDFTPFKPKIFWGRTPRPPPRHI